MKKAVLLVSGGIDSSTVLAMVQKQGFEVCAISFDYGQSNKIELNRINNFVKNYDVKSHKVINIDMSLFSNSALTSKDVDVPKYKKSSDIGSSIPSTYVPARNTIFLSFALGYAETIGANDIFLGIHQSDSANYPDCRQEYIIAYEQMANLATKVGVEGDKVNIHAPLLHMSKVDIVSAGLELDVDYSNTISCYDPSDDGKSCGKCLSCLVRLDAFAKNNVKDPVEYV